MLSIQIAFVDADSQQPDPATVGAVARQAVADLRMQGYTVQPAYTGAKGGDLFSIAIQIGQNIVDNKELLIALIGLSTPILTFLINRHEKQFDKCDTSNKVQQQGTTNFYLTINHSSVPVDPADLDDSDRLLLKLLQAQPNLIDTITPQSEPKIEVRVPQNLKRRRR